MSYSRIQIKFTQPTESYIVSLRLLQICFVSVIDICFVLGANSMDCMRVLFPVILSQICNKSNNNDAQIKVRVI